MKYFVMEYFCMFVHIISINLCRKKKLWGFQNQKKRYKLILDFYNLLRGRYFIIKKYF